MNIPSYTVYRRIYSPEGKFQFELVYRICLAYVNVSIGLTPRDARARARHKGGVATGARAPDCAPRAKTCAAVDMMDMDMGSKIKVEDGQNNP